MLESGTGTLYVTHDGASYDLKYLNLYFIFYVKQKSATGELGAQTVSHLEEVSSAGVEAMAACGSVAVVLPTTAYILRLRTDHIRKLLDGNVPVALGNDVLVLVRQALGLSVQKFWSHSARSENAFI